MHSKIFLNNHWPNITIKYNQTMDKFKDNKIILWILVVGILIILGYAAFSVVSILRRSTQQAEQALQPVTDLSNHLGTQIAQVLEPTPTVIVDPITIIHQVRSLARLETIQYSIEKVITAETGQGSLSFLLGDRLLFVAHGVVIAGVDLEQLGLDDLRVENNVLYVRLPEADVFIATLDNEHSYVYEWSESKTGRTTHSFNQRGDSFLVASLALCRI